MQIDLNLRRGKRRKRTTRNIKILAATHYAIQINNDLSEIAKSVGVKEATILEWSKLPEWAEACDYWQPNQPPIVLCKNANHARLLQKAIVSFRAAEKLWRDLITDGGHLRPGEMETYARLASFLKEQLQPPKFQQIGIEAITPLSRIRDFLKTLPQRIKYKVWALYIWLILS